MNHYKITNDLVIFDCGCCFARNGNEVSFNPDLHDPKHTIIFNCPATYKILQDGLTEGVFQLGSPDGKTQCKKLIPTELEHISALGAIVRPGCKQCLSGDVKIAIRNYNRNNRKFFNISIRELYKKFQRNHVLFEKQIISCDEKNFQPFDNKIISVMDKGIQDVYKLDIRIRKRTVKKYRFHKIEATLNHKFLTKNRGWVTLEQLEVGERILVVNSLKEDMKKELKHHKREKSFRDVCYANYEYKCVLCDWNEGSLDVNHLEGNRKTNNNPDNLCFMCPNHHRVFTEGSISKEEVIAAREKYKLGNSDFFLWAVYNGKEFIGSKDTYDIEVEGPNSNFIAGHVVVHNSKDSDGINITTRYQRKKNGKMELSTFHPVVDSILEKTYGENIYQESSLELAKQCAGFSLSEADTLRKGIGKKVPEIIAQCKKDFMEQGKSLGILTEKQLEEVFSWIEASQRYSFNHSHSWSYGLNSYVTAYLKAHFPISFYKSWFANEDKRENYINFVNEAKIFGINIYPPDLRDNRVEFYIKKKHIYFGLNNIKGLVKKDIDSLAKIFAENNWSFSDLGTAVGWLEFLAVGLETVSSKTAEGLVHSGALDCFGLPRAQLAYEYDRWSRLTATEKKVLLSQLDLYKSCDLTEFIRLLILDKENYHQGQIALYNEKVEKRKKSTRKRAKPPKPLVEPKEDRRLPVLREILKELREPIYTIVDTIDSIIFAEENLLGVALTRHKTDEIVNAAETATCMDVLNGRKDYVVLRVKVDEARAYKCKNGASTGKEMCFLKLSDRTGVLSAVAFPDCYEEYRHLLTRGNICFISGQLDKDSFIVKRCYNVS